MAESGNEIYLSMANNPREEKIKNLRLFFLFFLIQVLFSRYDMAEPLNTFTSSHNVNYVMDITQGRMVMIEINLQIQSKAESAEKPQEQGRELDEKMSYINYCRTIHELRQEMSQTKVRKV